MSEAIGDNVSIDVYMSTESVNVEIEAEGLVLDLYLSPERALRVAADMRRVAEKLQKSE